MGDVGIIYKLMPTDIEVDLEAVQEHIKGSLPPDATLNLMETKPIAFGLNSLEVQIILDDKKGGADELETFFAGIEGIGSVEVISQTLL
jgi:translation elongation factor aEF-1 beta